MKNVILLSILSVLSLANTIAQDISYEVSVSKSEILVGNKFKVTYKVINGDMKDFSPPTFEGFDVVSGPNSSSQYSSVNGEVTQSMSYSFILLANTEGVFEIESSTIKIGDTEFSSLAIPITVLPNPEGKIEPLSEGVDDPFGDFFNDDSMFNTPKLDIDPPTKPKKKRKTYKL